MPKTARLCIPVLIATCTVAACGGSASPDGRDMPHVSQAIDRYAPSLDEILNATVTVDEEQKSGTLVDGVWLDPESDRRIDFLPEFHMTGDLDGDGHDEAVELAIDTDGGIRLVRAGIFVSRDGEIHATTTAPVGTDVRVRAARIEGHLILVETEPEAGGPMETVTLAYRNGRLTPES